MSYAVLDACSLSLVTQTDGPPFLQVNVAEILTTKQVGVTLLFSHSIIYVPHKRA